MVEINYWSAFLFFGGPGIVLFIWLAVAFIIDENKKAER